MSKDKDEKLKEIEIPKKIIQKHLEKNGIEVTDLKDVLKPIEDGPEGITKYWFEQCEYYMSREMDLIEECGKLEKELKNKDDKIREYEKMLERAVNDIQEQDNKFEKLLEKINETDDCHYTMNDIKHELIMIIEQ